MDIAPNYAGTMMGITNMVGNIAGFVTPYVTGAIINENVRLSSLADFIFVIFDKERIFVLLQQTHAAWRIAFLVAAGIYVAFSAFFIIFGSTEVQPWNSYWETQIRNSRELRNESERTEIPWGASE